MYDNLSALDALRKALNDLEDHFQGIQQAYQADLEAGKWIENMPPPDDFHSKDPKAAVAEIIARHKGTSKA